MQRAFEDFLKCGRLEHGFLRVRCNDCHAEKSVAFSCVNRSAVANERLSLTAQGKVRYALKSAYRDGTTHVIFEPLDFLSRVAVLVPKALQRAHRTR